MNLFMLKILTLIAFSLLFHYHPIAASSGADAGHRLNAAEYASAGSLPEDATTRVVINELMVDPTPLIGLPDHEWIELLNTGSSVVDLSGWRLVVGTVSRQLPNVFIDPGGYIILCTAVASTQLEQWGKTAVFSLPALRNTGNRITLLDKEGNPADEVDYVDSWYNDNVKKNGGWTLERIDPYRKCGQEANWTASRDVRGGTPGMINSVFADNTDLTAPQILWAGATSPSTAEIIFSEPMETEKLLQTGSYYLAGDPGIPVSAVAGTKNSVLLTWSNAMKVNLVYMLTFNNLTDLCGNTVESGSVEIQWVELEPGDILINEILFNPWPGGADFVELHNPSGKRIDSGKLSLAGRDKNQNLSHQVSLKSLGLLIFPGDYLALTVHREGVMPFYRTFCPECVLQLPSMPPFNNDAGCVVLIDDRGVILDEFCYSEKMHHPLIHNREGVSLERVDPSAPAADHSNWKSASADAGYATPGYQNSQYLSGEKRKISMSATPSFSPNGDGYNDHLRVTYDTPHPGWIGNSWIFDTSGRPVLQLLKNQLLATSGFYEWDGTDETGSRIPPGPYILVMEAYDLDGNVERFKNAVVLTDRWD